MRNVLKVNPYNEEMQTKVSKALQSYAGVNQRMALMTAEKFGTDNLVYARWSLSSIAPSVSHVEVVAQIHSLSKHVQGETQMHSCKAITALMRGGPEVGTLCLSCRCYSWLSITENSLI